MSRLSKDIGSQIKQIRKRLGWSQARFAQVFKMCPSYVSMLETGERLPSLEMLIRISVKSGIPVVLWHVRPSK